MPEDAKTFYLIFIGLPVAVWLLFQLKRLIKWLWLHPHVNMEKLKRRLSETNQLRERLEMADGLLQDLDLQNMQRRNIRVKGVVVTWTDNISGATKQMQLLADGKTETTQQLRNLAMTVRNETTAELMGVVYKLPKRHGKSDMESVITIHGID